MCLGGHVPSAERIRLQSAEVAAAYQLPRLLL
jgi:hypothetical protein